MRNIKTNMLNRLIIQTNEAKVQGLTKTAELMQDQINKNSRSARDSDNGYVYEFSDLHMDVEKAVCDGIIRVADFYGANLDAKEIASIAESAANDIIKECITKANIKNYVGKYESVVAGEEPSNIEAEE